MKVETIQKWGTYRHAEELSGLSRTTLWRLISAGDIEAAKVGKAVRINLHSLDAYMERCSANSPDEL